MGSFVGTFKKMSPVKLAAMAGAALLLIAFFVFISVRFTSPSMAPLYANIDLEDGAKVVTELERMGIPYELAAQGTLIMVPQDDVSRIKMVMAEKGLPSTGAIVGYELFDKTDSLGTPGEVMDINKLRALEGELSRTISSLSIIDSAKVHLVIPKRDLFKRSEQTPTASVALKLKGSAELGKREVSAIRHLVATAVPRLKPSKITLVDNNANLLAPGDAEGDSQGMASTAQEHRIAFERRLKARIETLLAPTLGIDNINAQVSADIDFDRIERNSELYDPESQVAISVRGTSEVETFDEIDGANNVSVANNLPNADSAGGSRNAKRSIEKTDEQTNFAISKTIEKHVKEIGNINRISVAVLVDGSYEQIDGGYLYSDRSPEEIQQIDSLVKSAIGFDEDRGDSVKIVNMRFETEPEPEITESEFDWIKDQFRDIFPSLMFGAVAILAILTVIRPLINRIIEASEQAKRDAEANQEALAGPVALTQLADMSEEEEEESMISIDKIQAKVKSSTYKKINDVIDQHPDEAITVMRQWLVKESS